MNKQRETFTEKENFPKWLSDTKPQTQEFKEMTLWDKHQNLYPGISFSKWQKSKETREKNLTCSRTKVRIIFTLLETIENNRKVEWNIWSVERKDAYQPRILSLQSYPPNWKWKKNPYQAKRTLRRINKW